MCGAIRYRATGPVSHETLCHCQSCRKAAGAPVVAWVTFSRDAVAIERGKPKQFRSSPGVVRTFCGKCGTPLSYTNRDAPDLVDVTTCSLDRPDALPPRDHTWTSERLRFLHVNDELPQHRRARP